MTVETVRLFGIDLHPVTMDAAINRVMDWLRHADACKYVVTPNVDHVVNLQADAAMRKAYAGASLVLADGWPVVVASRWLGKPLPERVPGSDLVPSLLNAGQELPGFRVFLLGGAPGTGELAARQIAKRWPRVCVAGIASPTNGFELNDAATDEVIMTVNQAAPHLLVVGLGAPRQEIWLSRNA